MYRGRDFQKTKAYIWESGLRRRFKVSSSLSLEECNLLVAQIWNDYGRDGPPRIKLRKNLMGAYYCPEDHLICLSEVYARSRVVICHELAHALSRHGTVHGPEWLSVFIELITCYCSCEIPLPKTELCKSVQQAGLKLGVSEKSPQPEIAA